MATDPRVSRRKFDREIARFRVQEQRFREQGVWMLSCEYPQVLLAFAAPLSPQVYVPFGALIDFEDYDARPLKVTLVHPCTRRPLKFGEVYQQTVVLPHARYVGRLMRLREDPTVMGGVAVDQILQGYENDPESLPFLCIAGVRSYHEHPGHTGDSWWLYRRTGEGSFHTIVDLLASHGSKNIIQPLLQSQMMHVGYILQPDIEPQRTPPA